MSLKLKIEYLAAIRIRYYNSSKKEKTKILDELCAVTGFARKYAIRILALKHYEGKKMSGRKRVYSIESISFLKKLWIEMGQICSKKMVSALDVWIDFYEDDMLTDAVKLELVSMSAAAIDRHLKQYKATFGRRKRSGTKPGKMLKNIIPIKGFNTQVKGPGHVEADTVAHCGNSLTGKFIWSLTFTDVCSGWTDNRAIFSKASDGVLSAIMQIQNKLPYDLLSFNTDNGTEFLNKDLVMYFSQGSREERKKILFTRSRAYRKNDNCHVEQKNWTHVREIFGYERFDNEDLLTLMNDIYINHLNPLYNFFIPQLKLVEKKRIGSKYIRKYDKAKSPYQRLLESPELTMGQKESLRRKYHSYNPFILRKELNQKILKFNKVVEKLKLTKTRIMDEAC